ncbi:hypothetical protein WDU94_008170 [Cyamophila willieti]
MNIGKTNSDALKVLRKEADAICKRFASFKSVVGTIVIDSVGLPLRSTFEQHEAFMYAEMGHEIAKRAFTCFQKLKPKDSIEMVKIILGSLEAMILPDKSFTLMVIQELKKPTSSIEAAIKKNEQGPFPWKPNIYGDRDRFTDWGPYYSSEESSLSSLESLDLSAMSESEENSENEYNYYDEIQNSRSDEESSEDSDENSNEDSNENDENSMQEMEESTEENGSEESTENESNNDELPSE